MADVNWALGLQQGPNAGEAFTNAFQQGQQTRQQNMAKLAMAALVQDPNNQRALEALAQVDPQAAMQFKQQQQQNSLKQLDQHRESIKIGAQVIRSMQPRDEATWQQARQIYAQAGGDLTDVPQHWDENTAQYVQHIGQLADALSPEKPMLVPYQQGGGVLSYNPQTHQSESLIIPGEVGHAPGSPVANPPRVTDQATYDAVPPGQQYMTPDGHVRMKQGGQTGAPSGGFL